MPFLGRMGQRERANDVFEAATYIDSMEKKLEQDCYAMKEKLSAIKTEFKEKAGEIVAEVKAKGKKALNKAVEFLGIRKKLVQLHEKAQTSFAETEQTIAKIDAFGTGMREAARKAANTIRTFADKPEKEYGDKKLAKTELIKKPFEVKRKLLSGMLSCANGAIGACEKLSQEIMQREKAERVFSESEKSERLGLVAEQEYQYGAEAFEEHQRPNADKIVGKLVEQGRTPIKLKIR